LVRGKTGEPYPRYCAECEKELGDLEDREIPCRTEGCSGTWTWTKEQQLAAGVRPRFKDPEAAAPAADQPIAPSPEMVALPEPPAAEPSAPAEAAPAPAEAPLSAATSTKSGKNKKNRRRREPQPPERRCSACIEFLNGRKTQEIPCVQCGTPIYWPPESQLQTHLGNWAVPTLCGACKLAQVTAAREAAREALRHAHASTPGTPTSEPPTSEPPTNPSGTES